MEAATTYLQAILAAPDEDGPRLAYADWLATGGDTARAELIRAQCTLAREPQRVELAAQIETLLQAHARAWGAPFRALGASDPRFVRGMVEHLAIDAPAFLDAAQGLLAMTPLRSVQLREARPCLAKLCALRQIGELATLELRHNALTSADVAQLAQSPHLTRLRGLDLGFNDIDDRGVEALSRSPNLRALARLDLKANVLTDEGLASIGQLTSLIDVDFAEVGFGEPGEQNAIGPEGAKHLAGLALERLVIAGNPVGSAGAEAIAQSPRLQSLRILDLRDAQLGPAGAFALAASSHLDHLTRLDLSMNPIGDEGARALAASPCLSREMTLVMRGAKSRWVSVSAEALAALQGRFREVLD